MVKNVADFPS